MERIDTIERTITVAGTIEEVWEALTVADHIKQWFGDSAEIDLRPGGTFRIGWSEYDSVVEAVVEVVDPPRTFAYRWDAGTTDDGVAWTTKVTFTLEEANGATTVTVMESGLSLLPNELYCRCLQENASGWTAEMGDLQDYLDAAGTR